MEVPMVALNNASFQKAAPDQHSNNVEQPRSTTKRPKTNQATRGEERGSPQEEDIEEVEMLTRRTTKFGKLFQKAKKSETSWATVPEDATGKDRGIMCANVRDFQRIRNFPFEQGARLSKRHEALLCQAAQLEEHPGLLVAVAKQNETIADRIRDGRYKLLPCYVSEWQDAWLLLFTDFGVANMKQYCMQCI